MSQPSVPTSPTLVEELFTEEKLEDNLNFVLNPQDDLDAESLLSFTSIGSSVYSDLPACRLVQQLKDQAAAIELLLSQQEILQRRIAYIESQTSDMVWIIGQVGLVAMFAHNIASKTTSSHLRDIFASSHHGEGARDI